MELNLIKDNIDYEQSVGEYSQDLVIKEEYVIPDILPDISDVLMLDARPIVTSKEVLNGKVNVEVQIQFNILYMSREEDNTEVQSVNYECTLNNAVINAEEALEGMLCEAEVNMEHIHCIIANERKVCVQGVLNVTCEVMKKNGFEIVKEVESSSKIEFLKKPMIIDKMLGQFDGEMIGRTSFKIDMDRPEIGSVVKYFITLGKKDIKLYNGGIHLECIANIQVLYKAKNSRELVSLIENVLLSKDLDIEKVKMNMEHNTDFVVHPFEYEIKEDDMGENRILDIEFLVRSSTNVMYKEEVEMIEDAYCPNEIIEMKKEEFNMNIIQGNILGETLVKGDLELEYPEIKPSKVMMTTGDVNITDKKIMDDKVMIEGLLKVDVLFTTNDEKDYMSSISDEIPFSIALDLKGAKIDMHCITRLYLEMLEVTVEAGNICVRAIVKAYCRVMDYVKKEFLVNMMPVEGEIPEKKSSITIYVVQEDDNLWKIAKRYYATKEDIMVINDLEDENAIKPMDKLIIPGRAVI